MKKQFFTLLVALITLVINSNIQAAWNWTVTNQTNLKLIAQIEVSGSSTPYFALLNRSESFSVSSNGCFGRIKYIIIDDAIQKEMIGAKIITIEGKDINIVEKLADNETVKKWTETNDRRKVTSVYMSKSDKHLSNLTTQNPSDVENLIQNGTYYAPSSYVSCMTRPFHLEK